MHVDLAYPALNVLQTDDELIRDNLWWRRHTVVVQRVEVKKTVDSDQYVIISTFLWLLQRDK